MTLSRHGIAIDRWKELLFGDREKGPVVFKCNTIVRHSENIGYICHALYEVSGKRRCYCGWDLAPAYWGQGIAVIALSQLFDSFFGDQGIDTVISDCFSSNRRCKRVLEKLNYEPIPLGPFNRLLILVCYRCTHWICRFQLTAERWHARLQQTAR